MIRSASRARRASAVTTTKTLPGTKVPSCVVVPPWLVMLTSPSANPASRRRSTASSAAARSRYSRWIRSDCVRSTCSHWTATADVMQAPCQAGGCPPITPMKWRSGPPASAIQPMEQMGPPRGEGALGRGSGDARAAHPRRRERDRECDERDPAEHEEPDREIGGELEEYGERRDRLGEGHGRVPDTACRGGHGHERRDRHRDRREVRAVLDEVELTLQLLDLRAHVAERRVDLQRLVDRLRLREELEVALFLGLLREEARLQIGELVGDILRVDVRGHDLTVEQLQLAERFIEAIRRDADGDEGAAVLALAGLAHREDVAAETVRDGAC